MARLKKQDETPELTDSGTVTILLYGKKEKTVDAETAKRLINKGAATLKA
jgi:hypothetical protein